MKEVVGNIWDFHKQGYWIVITTNNTVKSNGEAVMGGGIALQAKQKFPRLPARVGRLLGEYGNVPQPLHNFRLITFPVKYHWSEKANLDLIRNSCESLVEGMKLLDLDILYMVRPGCGNGGLDWKDVKPILEKYLDDRFTVVNLLK